VVPERDVCGVAAVGRVELAYQTFGDSAAPPLLLIMGLGMQMIGWPIELCRMLEDRGHFVIRFDNRDAGCSTHLADSPPGDVAAVIAGDTRSVAYTLSDMALDCVGLLDALAIDSAHIAGASMGAAIAQTMAIEHPGRVRSLTSIMGSTGNPYDRTPTSGAIAAVFAPPARSREDAIERSLRISRVLASPGFPFDESAARERAALSFDRRHDPAGASRQLVALLTAEDRTARLNSIETPTIVIHGSDDPLVNPSGGRATAAAIRDAELFVIPGMGHDLPRALWPALAVRVATLTARVERHRV
jgi:pimeloyl-ACP methyl ester carboxylesterase